MRRTLQQLVGSAAALALCAATAPAWAQGSPFAAVPVQAQPVLDPLGWSITPTLLYGAGWDDNVLAADRPDQQVGDTLNLLSPSVALGFNGSRGRFSARYGGSLQQYHAYDTLNGFDQRVLLSAQRALTRRTTVFVRGGGAHSPTTELQDFVGVPFVRTGAAILNFRGGVETRLSRRVSIEATANVERVQFDQGTEFATLLRGGYGLGGAAALRRELSPATTLIGSYDMNQNWVGQARDAFLVQNGSVGLDHRLADSVTVSGTVGVSHLSPSVFGPAHTDPNWGAGLARTFRSAALDITYARRFETAYGFAGTTRTDEAAARVTADLSHGFYTRGGASWRLSHPLTLSDLQFRSIWTDLVFGFSTRPGVLIEGFWNRTSQSIDRPDALFGRNQFGIHVIATRSMRIH